MSVYYFYVLEDGTQVYTISDPFASYTSYVMIVPNPGFSLYNRVYNVHAYEPITIHAEGLWQWEAIEDNIG